MRSLSIDDRIVESGAHTTDVGVDVGDALTDVFVDARFGGEQAVVETILDLVDAAADDVRHFGLLARGLRRDLVDPGAETAEANVDVVDRPAPTPRSSAPRWRG